MIELASDAPSIRLTPVLTTTTEPAAVGIMPPILATADALDGETLERHVVALGNVRLQGLAQRVAAARSRLVDLTAAAEALSMAEDARHYVGADPEQWLLAELTEINSKIAEAEAGRKRMEARRVARSERVTPLRAAVGKYHSTLMHERDVLSDRVYLLNHGHGLDQAPSQLLRQAGLTAEQIAAVGTINPGEVDHVKYTARLAEIAPKIAKIEAWVASGYRDHQHLDGMGFESLIAAAQPAGEEVAP